MFDFILHILGEYVLEKYIVNLMYIWFSFKNVIDD